MGTNNSQQLRRAVLPLDLLEQQATRNQFR